MIDLFRRSLFCLEVVVECRAASNRDRGDWKVHKVHSDQRWSMAVVVVRGSSESKNRTPPETSIAQVRARKGYHFRKKTTKNGLTTAQWRCVTVFMNVMRFFFRGDCHRPFVKWMMIVGAISRRCSLRSMIQYVKMKSQLGTRDLFVIAKRVNYVINVELIALKQQYIWGLVVGNGGTHSHFVENRKQSWERCNTHWSFKFLEYQLLSFNCCVLLSHCHALALLYHCSSFARALLALS